MGVVAWHDNSHFVKEPIRKWELERRSHLNRLIRGLEIDCFEQLRVSKSVFFKLCRNLQEGDGLVRTRNVPITQAMVMFLHIVAHNLEYRVVHLDYYRSKETISSQFNNVLRDVMKVSEDYLKFHTYNLEGLEAIKWSWFENCVVALDGTHIPVLVFLEDRPKYRNRKSNVSTNVLAACGPDLRFIYVLPGWERSVGDSQELFNFHHASARNAVERSFGILKEKRWNILRTPSSFDIKTQIRIINACFVLHNLIRDEKQID
ncbi:hypothetical protein JHK87_019376 [Glycine soja]|nr:hypothetical protein JHK87_019376 [Glycine soja]